MPQDADGKSSSLSEEFGLVLYKKNLVSYFTRNSNLQSFVKAIPKLLGRTGKNNLLVRAQKLYLKNNFFVGALKVLSNFTFQLRLT